MLCNLLILLPVVFAHLGTSRGLVLVFDHFEEVRVVLGNADHVAKDGPVTTIDIGKSNDMLICGYQSGKVALFDIMKGASPLKVITDAHASPLVSIRFWRDSTLAAVSVDNRGNLNILSFSKMFMMGYVVDKQTLLDGNFGYISSLAPLPAPSKGQIRQIQRVTGQRSEDTVRYFFSDLSTVSNNVFSLLFMRGIADQGYVRSDRLCLSIRCLFAEDAPHCQISRKIHASE